MEGCTDVQCLLNCWQVAGHWAALTIWITRTNESELYLGTTLLPGLSLRAVRKGGGWWLRWRLEESPHEWLSREKLRHLNKNSSFCPSMAWCKEPANLLSHPRVGKAWGGPQLPHLYRGSLHSLGFIILHGRASLITLLSPVPSGEGLSRLGLGVTCPQGDRVLLSRKALNLRGAWQGLGGKSLAIRVTQVRASFNLDLHRNEADTPFLSLPKSSLLVVNMRRLLASLPPTNITALSSYWVGREDQMRCHLQTVLHRHMLGSVRGGYHSFTQNTFGGTTERWGWEPRLCAASGECACLPSPAYLG